MAYTTPIQLRSVDPFDSRASTAVNSLTRIVTNATDCILTFESLEVTQASPTALDVAVGKCVKDDVLIEITTPFTGVDIADASYYIDWDSTAEDGYYYIVLQYTYIKQQPAPVADIKLIKPSQVASLFDSTCLFLKAIDVLSGAIQSVHDYDPGTPTNKRIFSSLYKAADSIAISTTLPARAGRVCVDGEGIKAWDASGAHQTLSVDESGGITVGYGTNNKITLAAGIIDLKTTGTVNIGTGANDQITLLAGALNIKSRSLDISGTSNAGITLNNATSNAITISGTGASGCRVDAAAHYGIYINGASCVYGPMYIANAGAANLHTKYPSAAIDTIAVDSNHNISIKTGASSWTLVGGGTYNLDNVPDGSTYGRVKLSNMTAGIIQLGTCGGTLDNITDGSTYGKIKLSNMTAGIVQLGTCGGNLDSITDGSTYGKIKLSNMTAGIVQLGTCGGNLDSITDGSTFHKVKDDSLTSNEVDHTKILNGGGTNSHIAIDSHIANTTSFHGITSAQVGQWNVAYTRAYNGLDSNYRATKLVSSENITEEVHSGDGIVIHDTHGIKAWDGDSDQCFTLISGPVGNTVSASGTCTHSGTSSRLYDTGASFNSGMIGWWAYNRTTGVATRVTGYVDSNNLTLDDDIFHHTGVLYYLYAESSSNFVLIGRQMNGSYDHISLNESYHDMAISCTHFRLNNTTEASPTHVAEEATIRADSARNLWMNKSNSWGNTWERFLFSKDAIAGDGVKGCEISTVELSIFRPVVGVYLKLKFPNNPLYSYNSSINSSSDDQYYNLLCDGAFYPIGGWGVYARCSSNIIEFTTGFSSTYFDQARVISHDCPYMDVAGATLGHTWQAVGGTGHSGKCSLIYELFSLNGIAYPWLTYLAAGKQAKFKTTFLMKIT